MPIQIEIDERKRVPKVFLVPGKNDKDLINLLALYAQLVNRIDEFKSDIRKCLSAQSGRKEAKGGE